MLAEIRRISRQDKTSTIRFEVEERRQPVNRRSVPKLQSNGARSDVIKGNIVGSLLPLHQLPKRRRASESERETADFRQRGSIRERLQRLLYLLFSLNPFLPITFPSSFPLLASSLLFLTSQISRCLISGIISRRLTLLQTTTRCYFFYCST